MKFFSVLNLVALCFVFFANASFASFENSAIELNGVAAESLFEALPESLREVGPGAISKRAFDVVCSSHPNRGDTFFRCTYYRSDTEQQLLELTGDEASVVMTALPDQLLETFPGASVKRASEVVCSSHPNHGESFTQCQITK